jgi:Flp pilus assembly protein TadG
MLPPGADRRAAVLTGRDRGSMAVEFAILAPSFIVLVLLLVVGGRIVEAQGQVDGAARDAARAASVQVYGNQVFAAVQNAASSDLNPAGHNMCPGGMTPHWTGGTAAGAVSVTVQCTIDLSFFPGLGALTLTGHAAAPLDTFSQRDW